MTLPLGSGSGVTIDAVLFPATNTTGGSAGGLSSRNGLDQATVEAVLKQKYVVDNPAVQNPLQRIADLLGMGITQFVQGLSDGFQQVVDIFNGLVVTPINAAIQGVKDWFAGLLGFQDTTTANAINLQNYQIATQTAGSGKASWECKYPIADVTFPEFFLTYAPVAGITGPASTGTAHTHSLSGNDAFATLASYLVAPDESRGGYMNASLTTVFDTTGMLLRKTGAGSINNVYIEVFRVDTTGGEVRIASVDVSAMLTTTIQRIEVSIPGLITQARERYLVRVRNSSSVANSVGVGGVQQTSYAADTSMGTSNATDTNKTSHTASEVTAFYAESDILPFAFLAAVNLAETDQSFSDDFNRSALGGLWLAKTTAGGNIAIVNSQATCTGVTNSDQNAIYIRNTAGDGARVDANIYLNVLALAGQREGLLLHCNRDFTQIVYLGVNFNSAKIFAGPFDSLTEMATDTTGGSGFWSLYYDVANDKYVVLKDGIATGLEWASVGAAVEHGSDYRYGGLRVSLDTLVGAGAIDNWTLRDWTS